MQRETDHAISLYLLCVRHSILRDIFRSVHGGLCLYKCKGMQRTERCAHLIVHASGQLADPSLHILAGGHLLRRRQDERSLASESFDLVCCLREGAGSENDCAQVFLQLFLPPSLKETYLAGSAL